MKLIFTFLILFFTVCASDAAPVRRLWQDVKLPTQAVMEVQAITNPSVADTTGVLNASTGATSAAAVTVTSGLTNPDVPRNLVITPGATTADVAACTITVTGTNIFDRTITETFAFLDNASTATTGTKAFKTVTSVAFPASCEDSPYTATWSIGRGEKIGLKRCMAQKGDFMQSSKDGTIEATQPTCVADTDEVEKNTCDVNGTMDGTADWKFFFVQNFGCFP